MATKTKKNAAVESVDNPFAGMTPEQMFERMQQLERELAEAKAKKSAPRKLKPEDEAKRAARMEWERVDLAPEGTPIRFIQDKDRLTQIDAFPKVARMLKYEYVSVLLAEMAEQVSKDTGRTVEDVLEEATTRKAKDQVNVITDADEAEAALMEALGE